MRFWGIEPPKELKKHREATLKETLNNEQDLSNEKYIFVMQNLNSYLGPIRENDAIFDKKALDEKIQQSIKDYENGNVFRMKEEESVSDFVNRLNSSNLRQQWQFKN